MELGRERIQNLTVETRKKEKRNMEKQTIREKKTPDTKRVAAKTKLLKIADTDAIKTKSRMIRTERISRSLKKK